MNLGELRQQCAKELGRYDLVDSAFADNGMNFKINAAMKILDGLIPRPNNMKTKSFQKFPMGKICSGRKGSYTNNRNN